MRIVFVGPTRSSFANVDIRILNKEHSVVVFDSVLGYGLRGLISLITLNIRLMMRLMSADALYCWFADYHTLIPSLFARMLGKRVFIVAGGYDIGYEPQINFGARVRPIRWFCVRWSFKLAHVILPVSQYAEKQLSTLVPGLKAKVQVIYNAVRLDVARQQDIVSDRKPMALMISQGDSDVEIKRKGVDRFVEIAQQTPDIEFRLIGLAAGHAAIRQKASGLKNLTLFPGFVSLDDVIRPSLLQAAAYLQPSIEEAFGVAIVEAMGCGCIPVVAPVAAIPEVVGNVGEYCTTVEDYQRAIRAAADARPDDRLRVRERAQLYSEQRRSDEILKAIR